MFEICVVSYRFYLSIYFLRKKKFLSFGNNFLPYICLSQKTKRKLSFQKEVDVPCIVLHYLIMYNKIT